MWTFLVQLGLLELDKKTLNKRIRLSELSLATKTPMNT